MWDAHTHGSRTIEKLRSPENRLIWDTSRPNLDEQAISGREMAALGNTRDRKGSVPRNASRCSYDSVGMPTRSSPRKQQKTSATSSSLVRNESDDEDKHWVFSPKMGSKHILRRKSHLVRCTNVLLDSSPYPLHDSMSKVHKCSVQWVCTTTGAPGPYPDPRHPHSDPYTLTRSPSLTPSPSRLK